MAETSAAFLLDTVLTTLTECQLEGPAGSYRRTPHQDAQADPVACAAATNIHYMMRKVPGTEQVRAEWIDTLRSFEDPETGLFDQGPHGLIITAACTAALATLYSTPSTPPHAYMEQCAPEARRAFLQERCWCEHPERSSKETAALYVLLAQQESAGPDWARGMVDWLHSEVDEHTGLVRKGCIAPVELEGSWTLLPHLCSVLYPLAICQAARQPVFRPARLIDTALEVMEFHRDLFFKRKGHRHLPWVYTLSRCMRYTTHRHEEARQALVRFVPAYLDYLKRQTQNGDYANLPQAQWDLATLAELQLAVPGELTGLPPLRQVLDVAPFL
jgi:hypothetical protein